MAIEMETNCNCLSSGLHFFYNSEVPQKASIHQLIDAHEAPMLDSICSDFLLKRQIAYQ